MDGSQFVSPPITESGLSLRKRRRLPIRKLLIGAAAFLLLIGIAAYGRYYWNVGRFMVSTDDATVQAELGDHQPESVRLHRRRTGAGQSASACRRCARPD